MRIRLSVCGLLLLSALLPAADLAGLNLGQYVCGQRISPSDVAGKVVLFEYWGINCPPCRANIPHMCELAELADGEQLVVIANQCQETGKTEAVWKECGGNGRPCVIDQGQLPGASVHAIPRIFVFDHTGKQVFDGSPAAVDKAMIRKLLDAAPGPLVAPGDYVACRAEVLALKQVDKPITTTLRNLRAKAAKGKPDVQAEARRLLDGVSAYADRMLSQISSNRSTNPMQAWQSAQRLQGLLLGDELAKPCEAVIKEMKSDKEFAKELKAADALTGIKTAAEKMHVGMAGAGSARKDDRQAIISALDQVAAKYAGTVAASEASDLRKKISGEM